MKKFKDNVLDFLFETEEEVVVEKSFFDEAKEMFAEAFGSPKMALLTLGATFAVFAYAFIYGLLAYLF